jgi:hypothetical protein
VGRLRTVAPTARPAAAAPDAKEQTVERRDDGLAMPDELAAMLAQISGGDGRHARHEQHVIDIRDPDMRRQASCGAGQSRLRRERCHDSFATGLSEI